MKVLILCFLMLSGCATTTPDVVYRDRIVEVPTIVMEECPALPEVVPLLNIPIDFLALSSSDSDTAKAYVKSIEILKNKNKQYKEALITHE